MIHDYVIAFLWAQYLILMVVWGCILLANRLRKAPKPTRPQHPTRPTLVHGTWLEVDVNIAPAVAWLNSLWGVKTLSSCQGDVHRRTYVTFETYTITSLQKIVAARSAFMAAFGAGDNHMWFTIEDTSGEQLKFTLTWDSPEVLARFVQFHDLTKYLKEPVSETATTGVWYGPDAREK